MSETKYLMLDRSVAAQVEKMISANRGKLIEAAVPDAQAQAELLKISESINRINARDPSLVAAWGLGCGGSCLVGPGGQQGLPVELER